MTLELFDDGSIFIDGQQAEGQQELDAVVAKLAVHLGYQLTQQARLGRFQHPLDKSRRL